MKTSLLSEIKTAIQIALFKHTDMHHVAVDKYKTKYAYYIIIIASLLGLIGGQLFMGPFKPTIMMAIGMAVFQVIMAVIGIYILSIIATSIFKGHAKHDEFFRVMGYSMVIGFLSIVPMISIIIGIWGLVLVFIILKTIHKLTTGGAVGTIIVGVVVMWLISMVVGPVFAKLGLGYQMKGSYKFEGLGGNEANIDMMDENNFEINVPGEGGGTVKMDENKVTIKGPDGQEIQFTIPTE